MNIGNFECKKLPLKLPLRNIIDMHISDYHSCCHVADNQSYSACADMSELNCRPWVPLCHRSVGRRLSVCLFDVDKTRGAVTAGLFSDCVTNYTNNLNLVWKWQWGWWLFRILNVVLSLFINVTVLIIQRNKYTLNDIYRCLLDTYIVSDWQACHFKDSGSFVMQRTQQGEYVFDARYA